LADALEHLWLFPDLRERLGQAGRQYILAHHTWEKVAEQILAMAAEPATVAMGKASPVKVTKLFSKRL
jgi:hypothetical protein